MKRTIRIMGLCALVALVAASCQKNEGKMTNTLSATLNQPTFDDKTYIGENDYLMWSAGDQIMVFDANCVSHTFNAVSSGTTHTDFVGDDMIDPSVTYWSFYPIDYVTNLSNGVITFSIPSTQTYVEGSIATNTYPIAASNGGSGTEFTFRGLFGILAIPLTGDCTIGSVEVTDAAFNLHGQTSTRFQDIDPTLVGTDAKGGKDRRTITLTFGEDGLTLTSTPQVIRFVLRPLACSRGFSITVKDLNDNVIYTRSTTSNNIIMPERIRLMPTLNITEP